jgi:hypothetical protein
MHPHNDSPSRDTEAMERRVLIALCCSHWKASGNSNITAELHSYRWRNAEHRIVFEALAKVPPCDADTLRELLPAQATRMGFPDVDWQQYFARDSNCGGDAQKLICELLKAAEMCRND